MQSKAFSWRDFLRSCWTRGARISAGACTAVGLLDFIAGRFDLGIPTVSSHAPLGFLWFVMLLVFIAVVAALAEALERLEAVPVKVPIGGQNRYVKSIATYSVLFVGLAMIYAGSYFSSRPVVISVAPAPSPSPTPAIAWVGNTAAVSINPHMYGQPVVWVAYRNPSPVYENLRWFHALVFKPVYRDSSAWRTKQEVATLRALVKNEIANNPEPGAEILPPQSYPDIRTFNLPALSRVEWNRYLAGMDGLYYVIYAVVTGPHGSTTVSDELCGVKVTYSLTGDCAHY